MFQCGFLNLEHVIAQLLVVDSANQLGDLVGLLVDLCEITMFGLDEFLGPPVFKLLLWFLPAHCVFISPYKQWCVSEEIVFEPG